MVQKVEGRAAAKFRDGVFQVGEVFLWAVFCDHRNKNNLKSDISVVLVFFDDENACVFGYDGSGADCNWSISWIWGRCVGVGGCAERLKSGVLEDKAEETEDGITGCDGHSLILNTLLEEFQRLTVWWFSRCCNLGHITGCHRKKGKNVGGFHRALWCFSMCGLNGFTVWSKKPMGLLCWVPMGRW